MCTQYRNFGHDISKCRRQHKDKAKGEHLKEGQQKKEEVITNKAKQVKSNDGSKNWKEKVDSESSPRHQASMQKQ